MIRKLSAVMLLLGAGMWAAPSVLAAPQPTSAATSHVGSTWDASDTMAHIQDPTAVAATVSADKVLTPTDNPVCDLYTTTFTIAWQAAAGRTLTAVVVEDDSYGYGWRALETSNWTMTPSGQVWDEQSPVVQNWYLKGTHRSDPNVCPRGSRTINRVEIYVDGPAPHPGAGSSIKPPSRNHLAVVWTWPDQVRVLDPARVSVSLSFYYELESSEGLCEAHVTELDTRFTAIGSARIIAVGVRSFGTSMHYQNGDTDSYVLGTVAHEYFLTGTTTKSSLCPADQVSTDRIDIYTDTGKND